MKAVILNFTGQRENWGCQATSWNLYRFCWTALKPLGLNHLAIVPLPPGCISDRFVQWRHGARIRAIYSDPNPSKQDLEFLERLASSRFGDMVDRVRSADVVLFQGEGTMGPSRYYENLRFFGLPFLASRLWKKPVISLNQSFVIDRDMDRAAAVNIFDRFEVVALRESRSLERCLENRIDTAVLCPDMAFLDALNTVVSAPAASGDAGYFCITGSAGLGGYRVDDYVNTLAEVAHRTGLTPVFLYSRSSDSIIGQKLTEILGEDGLKILSVDNLPSYKELLPVLASAKFTIGGRYHSSVSSMAMRTPVILTAGNTHKSEGLGQLVQISLPIHASDDTDGIVNSCLQILASLDAKRAELDAAMARMCQTYGLFSQFIQAVVAQSMSEPSSSLDVLSRRFADAALASVKTEQGEDYSVGNVSQEPAFELLQAEAKNTTLLSKAERGKHMKLFSQLFRT
ncbi:polysaccharide pyruvyl transferase family protein, partial [Octadecabacter sp.]|nr:polysaccharide pyruvyl transferase family protein [Octadecabacter sp.]